MRKYFVDTWLVIASIDSSDQHHRNALGIGSRLRDAPLVTHDAIFHEVLAFFASDGRVARQLAVDAVRQARQGWTVVAAERSLFDRALLMYERRGDEQYSLVDCMSMIVMREHGITHVLTNDHHFSQEDFTLVNA